MNSIQRPNRSLFLFICIHTSLVFHSWSTISFCPEHCMENETTYIRYTVVIT